MKKAIELNYVTQSSGLLISKMTTVEPPTYNYKSLQPGQKHANVPLNAQALGLSGLRRALGPFVRPPGPPESPTPSGRSKPRNQRPNNRGIKESSSLGSTIPLSSLSLPPIPSTESLLSHNDGSMTSYESPISSAYSSSFVSLSHGAQIAGHIYQPELLMDGLPTFPLESPVSPSSKLNPESGSYLSNWVQFSSPVHKVQPGSDQLLFTPALPGPKSRLLPATGDLDYPLDPALSYSPSNGNPYKFSPYKSPGGKAIHEPLFQRENLARVEDFLKKDAPKGVSQTRDVVASHAMYAQILAERGHRGPFLINGKALIDIDMSRDASENCRLLATFDGAHDAWVDQDRKVVDDFDDSAIIDMFAVIDKENERRAYERSERGLAQAKP
ncbi:hypothetical protein Micbo1qcDRAFT_235344 [Microdochium bolleyi]|uniref:Uncharacterized protein n=1 Tax=Microdochium bolleyi TaxID=196109 RepID=A0A136IX15_9PEZI|nr:hypothetical protein Micbo1qcDRAFT_235344 [Microdochium bolleyi]